LKKTVFRATIASAVASALVAIYSIWSEGVSPELLYSCLSVCLSGSFLLIFVDVREKRRGGWFPVAGIVATLAALVLVLLLIWGWSKSDAFVSVTVSLIILSVLCGIASRALTPVLARRFRWAPIAVIVIGAMLAHGGILLVWGQEKTVVPYLPAYGGLAILWITAGFLVTMFARASAEEREKARGGDGGPICPHCGESLPLWLRDDFPEEEPAPDPACKETSAPA
jgi:hypothetical protein